MWWYIAAAVTCIGLAVYFRREIGDVYAAIAYTFERGIFMD